MRHEMLAQDSKILIVKDQKMKEITFTQLCLRASSALFLLFLTLGGLCLIPDSHFNWIDGRGPIVGFVILLLCLFILSIKWMFKKKRVAKGIID